ncbi:MAG TPA: HAD family hydrolase [Bacillota bacterium]|nr:HAD family hydrolase [Bacillota bacterium]
MDRPKMIIFDYGQTLVDEEPFDGLKGTEAVLREATRLPMNVSAEVVQALADELNKEIGRASLDSASYLEVHNHIFQNYLYDYFGVEFTKSSEEIERIFENAATVAKPTKHIQEFLQFLQEINIRTGVISNMPFSGRLLTERIYRYIPSHHFDFIIASSEYIFRKPHWRIFELGLRKAGLNPSEVWYCGDNAVCDVDGAADAGIFSVWYKGALRGNDYPLPQREALQIKDWNELYELLA